MPLNNGVGTVHKVYPNKLIVEIPDTSDIDHVYDGYFYKAEGIHTYLTIYKSFNEKYIYQIVGLYEQERPYLPEEESKLTSNAFFEAVPVGEIKFGKYEYGLLNYPMIGEDVFVTINDDLELIFETSNSSVIELGTMPSQNNYSPYIEIDNLFTHHLSILGNTSSGKSTTMRKIMDSINQNLKIEKSKMNFFVFDIHNEYDFFNENDSSRELISMSEIAISLSDLTLEDWINLVRPANKVQLPILKQALRLASVLMNESELDEAIKVYCAMQILKNQSTDAVSKRFAIMGYLEDTTFLDNYPENSALINEYHAIYANMEDKHRRKLNESSNNFIKKKSGISISSFWQKLRIKMKKSSETVDSFENLHKALNYLFDIEEAHGNRSVRSHSQSLITRIEELQSNYEDNFFENNTKKRETLNKLLNLESNKPFVLFDVSELPNDDLLFFTSHVLEKLYQKQKSNRSENKKTLVHCVFDEAHQYIRETHQGEKLSSIEVFEKVAREGRKFGLFKILLSQRPSELSQTVLSQCNNFILHRIRNSVDLEFMKKSIPYISAEQIHRLSYMKRGSALFVGEAFPLPMELEVKANDNLTDISSTTLPSEVWV